MHRIPVTFAAALVALSMATLTGASAPASAGQVATTAPSPAAPTPSPSASTSAAAQVGSPVPEARPLPDSVRPPAGSRIAYVAGEVGTSPAIRIVTADGSRDSFEARGTLPTWAPAGDRIAYTCKPKRWDYIGSICIRDLRSETTRVVIADGTLARWSPAGELIAFTRDVWVPGDTWIYRPDPRATWQLPGGMAVWSPTGEWLRYETTRGEPERPVINIVHPDGSGARELGEGWLSTWSPDGRRLAMAWWDDTRSTVTAIDIETGARETLFETDAPIIALRWLPGDGFAFVAEHDYSSTGDLRVIELSTGVERALTSGLAVWPDLTVSPDGQWLAFSVTPVDGTSDIYIASRQGGWAQLTNSGRATRPVWGP